MQLDNSPRNSIEFKTTFPNLTVLKISTADITAINNALVEKSRTAPMMFAGLQVIVDLTQVDEKIDIKTLKTTILDNGINPVALMTNSSKVKQAALDNRLGWLPLMERPVKAPRRPKTESTEANGEVTTQSNADNNTVTTNDATLPSDTNATNSNEASTDKGYEPKKTADENYQQDSDIETSVNNLLLEKQIRSGQRVYSHGDLTIIGSVGAGAEVIANGNIHVYGALRGRALAGAKGDENAKIFCQDMQAELVSIAGQYTYFDDIQEEYKNKPLQISLQDERIVFFPL